MKTSSSPRHGGKAVVVSLKNAHSGRPPRVYPAQLKKHSARLHQALRDAIPALRGTSLSSSVMEDDFNTALACTDPEDFKFWYLEANLLKRYVGEDLSNSDDRVTSAVEKLMESEIWCRESNWVFSGGLDRSNGLIPLHLLPTLKRARRILGSILGRFPWDRFPSACDFSPGATTEFPRKQAALHYKWLEATQVTPRAIPYVLAFQKWAGIPELYRSLEVVCANRVFTVEKNFERDRTACKPVTWNGFLQKGVGKLIRRRLQRTEGLLQKDAQEYHGVLAKIGSSGLPLVTRDLSSASDSLSLGLLDVLLPPDWLKVILDLRETHGILPDGTCVEWQKVSSMGNGYTFELETAVFYALVKASCSKDSLVSAYGDDLIFPACHVEKVDEILSFVGFKINREKSFGTESSFRESCGGHYFMGHDVKPFYITKLPTTLGDIINLHNDIIRWHGGVPRPETRWFQVWCRCREAVPRVFWGPPGTQGVLWAEWDDCRPTYVPRYQAFKVAVVTREVEATADLSGRPVGSKSHPIPLIGENVDEWGRGHIGAYLQKLWRSDPKPWESSEVSKYQTTGTRERSSWLYVDRAMWTCMTAVTLCN